MFELLSFLFVSADSGGRVGCTSRKIGPIHKRVRSTQGCTV